MTLTAAQKTKLFIAKYGVIAWCALFMPSILNEPINAIACVFILCVLIGFRDWAMQQEAA